MGTKIGTDAQAGITSHIPMSRIPVVGPQISSAPFCELCPMDLYHWQWNHWYDRGHRDKGPVPKWNGKHLAKTLNLCCEELRVWGRSMRSCLHSRVKVASYI